MGQLYLPYLKLGKHWKGLPLEGRLILNVHTTIPRTRGSYYMEEGPMLSFSLHSFKLPGHEHNVTYALADMTFWPRCTLELWPKINPFSLKLLLSGYFITAPESKAIPTTMKKFICTFLYYTWYLTLWECRETTHGPSPQRRSLKLWLLTLYFITHL